MKHTKRIALVVLIVLVPGSSLMVAGYLLVKKLRGKREKVTKL